MKLKHSLSLLFCSISLSIFATNEVMMYPADIIDLTNWKLTLPIDEDLNTSPDEIKQPALATYSNGYYFWPNDAYDGVIFKAHAGGVTTNNSGYPRCELREMKNNGVDQASWASNDGDYHILEVTEKIIHYPDVKHHVVVAQIHDANDDIVMLRLETSKLFLEFNGSDGPALTTSYVLGTEFTFKIIVHNGTMEFYYNGNLFHTAIQNFSGAYFKAGMYTQSSCQGSNQVTGELCTAYGQMELLNLSIYHGASLPTSKKLSNNKRFIANMQAGDLVIEGEAGDAYISILDTQGKEVLSKEAVLTGSRDIVPINGNLPTGVYVVSITQDGKNFCSKIVVK